MFNFQDFVLFTGVDKANEMKYATIAAGIISYVEDTYGIYLSQAPRVLTVFSEDSSTLLLGVTPINSITSITQDALPIDYTYYGRDVSITSSITDYTIPFTVTANIGFSTVPLDLKLAVYTHIQAMFYAIDNHTPNVSKVVNTTGNTTFFRDLAIPLESSIVYDFYSKRQLVLV